MKKRTFIITLERTQNGKKLDWRAKTEIKAYEPPKIGTGRTLLVDPPIYETVTKIEEIVTNIVNYSENENGLNTKENELPAPRGDKEVCPHPANQVFLLNGWYRCEACNGKWKSKIK